jgi:hypothetical protein
MSQSEDIVRTTVIDPGIEGGSGWLVQKPVYWISQRAAAVDFIIKVMEMVSALSLTSRVDGRILQDKLFLSQPDSVRNTKMASCPSLLCDFLCPVEKSTIYREGEYVKNPTRAILKTTVLIFF